MKSVGEVTHYYGNIGVAIVKLSASLKAGETVRFKGSTTDFAQKVESIQQDHADVKKGKKKAEVGIKVDEKVRVGDGVFLEE